MPLTDGPGALEGQVAVVAQVGLEQAAVVAGVAGDDGLDGPAAVGEAGIVVVEVTRVFFSARQRAGVTHRALEEGEGAVDAGVGPRDAGDRDADRPEPAHVVAGVIQVEYSLGN